VKCSLLTLSTFIDGELPDDRRSEVDAHLVGCPRCSAGAATLREERDRVGRLARVHVDPESAQSMLEQVGIAVDSVGPLAPSFAAPLAPQPSVAADQLPWQGGLRSPALPWTPRRPDAPPQIIEAPAASSTAAELQPDLPLDRPGPASQSWQPAAELMPASQEGDWADAAAVTESWEAALPPPVEVSAHLDEQWDLPPGPVTPAQAARVVPLEMAQPPLSPPLPPELPRAAQAPTRLATASGPGGFLTRMRDAVAVRMALSRGGDPTEQSLQIVSGAPSRPAAKMTPPPLAAIAEVVAPAVDAPPVLEAAPAAAEEVELNGIARPLSTPVPARSAAVTDQQAGSGDRQLRGPGGPHAGERAAPSDPASWNAFAASSYPVEIGVPDQPPVTAPRRLGRHSRAIARERVPVTTRMARPLAGMAAGLRGRTVAAAAAVGRVPSGISKSGPNSRLLAVVAGVGLIFVGALLIGHAGAHPAPAAAARSAPASAVTLPKRSATAQPSAAAATAVPAPSAATAQTFGSGAGGFQLVRLRYGAQATFMRVVFDLSGPAIGSPTVAVSPSGPTSLLVTFTGTSSAGSWRAPPTGTVISAVTLVSSSAGKTVYRIDLTHSVRPVGSYLAAPTRFVLDLH
jgi:anti-sigma factor RsiW